MQHKQKIFKYLLIGIVSIFLLMSISIIILIHLINPNKYKPLIIASVNNNTGRKLQLDGDIRWQIWPNIGLQIKQISLSNPGGFESSPFFEIQDASVALDLLPLFRNRMVINDLSINGLKIGLITKNDKHNWTFSPADNPDKNSETSAMSFDLHSLSIANSDITYINFDNKTKKEIKNQSFSLDNPTDGGIHFDSKTKQLNLEGVNFSLNKNLQGTIQLDLQNDPKLFYNGSITLAPFSLNQLLTRLNMKPINIQNKAMLDNVSFKTNFEGNNTSASFSNLVLNVGKSILQGNVKVNNFSPVALQNDIRINQIELSDLINTHGYQIPMREITLNGTLSNANLDITEMAAREHLIIKDVMLYGINIQNHINIAEKNLTIKQFTDPIQLLKRLITMLLPSHYISDLKQKTDLGKLDTNIVLQNRVLTTPGFTLTGPILRITNRGLINFNKEYINYHTYTKIVSVPANSLLGSMSYPYIIQGNLNNPTTSVDEISLQKQIVSYYAKMGINNGVIDTIKHETVHLWDKIFH